MSLREELERRRSAQSTKPNRDDVASSDVVSAKINEPGAAALPATVPSYLRITKTSKQCWLLPWACFHGASYEPSASAENNNGNCERLHMVFLRHEVVLHGFHLNSVVDSMEEGCLRQLREVSEMYQPAAACAQKVLAIIKIEVTPR